MHRCLAWIIGSLSALSLLAAPPRFDPEKDVSVTFRKGSVILNVPEGVHLKAALTEVALKEGQQGRLESPKPAPHGKDELGDGIWHGRVVFPLKGEGLKDPAVLVVSYQPCTEGKGGVCFAPIDRELTVKAKEIPPIAVKEAVNAKPLSVDVPKAASAKSGNSNLIEAVAPIAQVNAEPVKAQANRAETNIPGPAKSKQSLFWLFLALFGSGVIASLTPCVYPMIPITMAVIGAKGGGLAKGLTLSLMLVLGIAVTYTSLGVVASLLGVIAGSIAQHPAFLIPVSVLFTLFALSLFGAFEIRLPEALQTKLQGSGSRKGYLGAFIIGMVLGPISAPCIGPILVPVLVAIGKEGHVVLGALQLFTFALGMGVLFLVVGTFSAALPRSGDWLIRLKQFMGLVVLGFAAWNIRLIVPEWSNYAMWGVVLFSGAVVLGSFRPAEDLLSGFQKGLGILALSLGVLLGLRAVETGLKVELLPKGRTEQQVAKPGASMWMEQDFEGALSRAKSGKKLLLVDTYAEWCAACKELDEKTWPDPKIAEWIHKNAVAIRIDTYKVRKDLNDRFDIPGYPTILLLDAEGRELRRISGFQDPAEMLKFLEGR